MNGGLHIALSANERYVIGATVAAAGVAAHAQSETPLVFHLFTEGVKDESFAFFASTLKRLHERTTVVRHECDESVLAGLPYWAGSRMAAVRCHYATLLPDVDRCLYLDCDILYLARVEEHFSHADASVYACAVLEECAQTRMDECQWISEHVSGAGHVTPDRYFNSGVVLFNLKKMREDGIPEHLASFFRDHPDVPSPDQDALNVAFDGCVKLIPPKFNRLQILLNDEKVMEHPVIHYVCGNPWLPKYGCVANGRFRLWHRFADKYVWQKRGRSYAMCFPRKVLAAKYVCYWFLRSPIMGWWFAVLMDKAGIAKNGGAWRTQQVENDITCMSI